MNNIELDQADQNLTKLVTMRNVVMVGEILTIVVFATLKNIQLPLIPLSLLLILMGSLNVWTAMRLRKGHIASEFELLLQVLADIATFSVFLYYTGGATNPFGWFFLLPIMVSATLLPRRYTTAIALITIAIYSLLMVEFVPLSTGGEVLDHADHMHHEAVNSSGFSDHIVGMWLGFVFSAGLVAWFVAGLAESLRQRDRCLAEAREQALRDERLVALGTLATGAAHDLGTPLGTMALVTESIAEDFAKEDYPDLHDNLSVLDGQLERCKETLSVLSANSGEARAMGGEAANVEEYLNTLVHDWQQINPDVDLTYRSTLQGIKNTLLADATITHALVNILDNAADESPDRVELTASVKDRFLNINIRDWGNGMNEEMVRMIGAQQFTTKDDGLGIGLYLAYSTIKRMGGSIEHCLCGPGCSSVDIHLPLLSH